MGFCLAGCRVQVKAGGEDEPPPPPPPAPAPEPEPAPEAAPKIKFGKFKLPPVDKDGKVQLPGPVLFETGSAQLKPESDAVLDIVRQYLEAKPEVTKLRIEGHTDTDNDDASNQKLSEGRAMAVAQWLVGKGTNCKRLVPVGFGESKLVVSPEATPDDKSKNRRVVFINAEINGKAIGGLPLDGGGKIAGDACK
jgi:OOP family OmpA-OmpF porin